MTFSSYVIDLLNKMFSGNIPTHSCSQKMNPLGLSCRICLSEVLKHAEMKRETIHSLINRTAANKQCPQGSHSNHQVMPEQRLHLHFHHSFSSQLCTVLTWDSSTHVLGLNRWWVKLQEEKKASQHCSSLCGGFSMAITLSQKEQPINDIFKNGPIADVDFYFFLNQQKLGSNW